MSIVSALKGLIILGLNPWLSNLIVFSPYFFGSVYVCALRLWHFNLWWTHIALESDECQAETYQRKRIGLRAINLINLASISQSLIFWGKGGPEGFENLNPLFCFSPKIYIHYWLIDWFTPTPICNRLRVGPWGGRQRDNIQKNKPCQVPNTCAPQRLLEAYFATSIYLLACPAPAKNAFYHCR